MQHLSRYTVLSLLLVACLLVPVTTGEIVADKTVNDFRVLWDYTPGLTTQTYEISVQNLQPVNRIVSISSFINETSFMTSEIGDITFNEWKLVPYNYTVDHYDYIEHSEYNDVNGTWNNWTESVFNYTEIIDSEKLGWKACKSLLFQDTGSDVTDEYGDMLIPKFGSKEKEGTINGTKYFKLTFLTPIQVSSNGFGSSGRVSLFVDGDEFCPYWNTSWSSRKLLPLNQLAGISLHDYQVIKNISYLPEMQNDFDDLRFTFTNGTLIPYWFEESIVDGSYVNVWLNVSTISNTSDTQIWMYYGNDVVGNLSSGNDTFIQFVEDKSGTYLESLVTTPSSDLYFRTRFKNYGAGVSNVLFGFSNVGNASDDCVHLQSFTTTNWRYFSTRNDGVQTFVTEVPHLKDATYHIGTIEYLYGVSAKGYIDDNQIGTTISSNYPDETMGLFAWQILGTLIQDWAFIAKYNATEPTWASDGEPQYYSDSLISGLNNTIESDGTITVNDTLTNGTDTNDTATSIGNSSILITTFNNSDYIRRNITISGDDLDWYNVANQTGWVRLHYANGTYISDINATAGNANFTDNITAGDYVITTLPTPYDHAPISNETADVSSWQYGYLWDVYYNDNNMQMYQEFAGDDFNITYNFTCALPATQVEEFILYIDGYYDGNPAHAMDIYVLNNLTGGWDLLGTMEDSATEISYTFVFDGIWQGKKYKNLENITTIRLAHDVSESNGHYLYIDRIILRCEPHDLIESYTPTDLTPSVENGTNQTFSAEFIRESNVTWYIDGNVYQNFTGVNNSSIELDNMTGIYNVTLWVWTNEISYNEQYVTWEWTVYLYSNWVMLQDSISEVISVAGYLVSNIGVVIVTAFSLISLIILCMLIGAALSVTNIIFR